MSWATQPFVILSLGTGKISVAFLILRIMGHSVWRKRFLYFTMVSSFAVCCLAIIVTYAQCTPAAALWDPSIKAKCWKPGTQTHIAIFAGSTFQRSGGAWVHANQCATKGYLAFMDLCLALLPITIIWNLQIAAKKKAAMGLILGMGVL